MKEKNIVKISFVGDIMSKIEQNKAAINENGTYDYDKIFKNIKTRLNNTDFLVGNLETPIAGEQLKYSYKPFSFNTPDEFAIAIKNAGFSLVTTANNHCMDRGIEGINKTIETLDKIGLDHIGTYKDKSTRDKIYIKEIEGIKFAFISYTYGTNANINGYYLDSNNKYVVNLLCAQEKRVIYKKNLIIRGFKKVLRILRIGQEKNFSFSRDKEYLQVFLNDIKEARKKADYVIFCMHSGGQYNKNVDKYTKALSKFAFKNGVDFIIGCHPHVVHGSKILKQDKFVAYSLGNFCSTPYTNKKQINDLPDYTIICNLYFNKNDKKLKNITFNIAKSILDNNGYSYLEYIDEYINKVDDPKLKNRIKDDSIIIANKFYNGRYKEIEKEYYIM